MELPLVQHPRTDRVPIVRPVSYEILTRLEVEEPDGEAMRGKAVLLNISQGGMLLLMSGAVSVKGPSLWITPPTTMLVLAMDSAKSYGPAHYF